MAESTQEKILTPPKMEKVVKGTAFQAAPFGEFFDEKQKKTVKFVNRIKVGNGFKAIAVFKSRDQIEALLEVLNSSNWQKWAKKYLPQTVEVDETQDEDESESVDDS